MLSNNTITTLDISYNSLLTLEEKKNRNKILNYKYNGHLSTIPKHIISIFNMDYLTLFAALLKRGSQGQVYG